MTITPERIAEIEELAATKAPMVYVRAGSIRELCRLALLGLRVEEAPTCSIADAIGTADALRKFSTALLDDKRVALVVLP